MTAREQAFLDAIYEDPDDDAPRAVYADWLQERGDPRGELVALQLARAAGTATEAGEARERALLDKHGKRWAGALDRWFEPQGRVFERGFLAGGVVTGVPRVFDPAWRLVRALEARGDGARLLALLESGELVSLRALHGIDEATASEIARGPRRALTELGFAARPHDEPPREHPLAVCRALPELRVLAVEPRPDTAAWLAGAPVLGRLERLVILFDAYRPPAPLVAAIAGRRDVRAVGLVDAAGPYLGSSGARAALARGAATGALDELVIRCRPPARRTDYTIRRAVTQVLEAAPATLRTLVLDLGRAPKLAAEDRAAIDALVARFRGLEHASLPWSPAPARVVKASGAALTLRARGASLLEVGALDALWAHLGELGVTLDAVRAGTGLRPLGEPLAKLRAWAKSSRVRDLALVHDGGREELSLHRGREPADTIAYARLVTSRPPRELAAWFARLVGTLAPRRATLDGDGYERGLADFHVRGLDDLAGAWLMFVGAHLETLLPADEVAALADELGGLFVQRAPHGYVLGAAATPAEATPRRLAALQATLERIAIANLPAQLDYDLRGRVQAALGTVAKELGLPAMLDGAPFEPGFRKGGTPMRELVATLHEPLAAPELEVTLARRDPDGYAREVLASGPARTRGQLDKLLATAAKRARTEGETFFTPKRTQPRRR